MAQGVRGSLNMMSVLARRKVLLVDDEAFFLESVREGLLATEPTVEALLAGDGLEALDLLDKHEIDVVVSDIRMPGLDGVGLLAEMINRGISVPVILLSAFRDPAHVERAVSLGAVSFLDKPVDYDALIQAIQDALAPAQRSRMQGFSLPSLLQLMDFDNKSATLSVRSGENLGRIFVSDGDVVDAWYGSDYGRDAFRKILQLPNPILELVPLPEQVHRNISQPTSSLLFDAIRQQDEDRRAGSLDDEWEAIFDGAEFGEPPTRTTAPIRPSRHERYLAKLEASLQAAAEISGAVGAALVDYETGMTLGTSGGGKLDLDVAAAGNTEVVRAKMQVMKNLGIEGGIKDILITLEAQFHLIHPIPNTTLFLYLALDSKTGNLAMARHRLQAIEQTLPI